MKSLCLNTCADAGSPTSEAPLSLSGSPSFGFNRKTLTRYAKRWYRRFQLRRSLEKMDVRSVEKDIGVVSGTLIEEAYKPFWQE